MAALAAPVSASGQDGPSLASPVLDPLNFTFPTSEPEAVSLWRPPLYPVPWEPTPNDHFYFTRPISADEVNWPLARYRYGGLLYSTPHTGIDIPAPKGTPILAAGPGTVIWAGYGLYFLQEQYQDPYGIAVAIKHDFGYKGQALYTIYGHMDRTLVYRGQHVEAGEQIGIVGETGNVSGPHLHFEVRVGDNTFFVSRNPELWISPPQGWGVLVGRLSNGEGRPIFQQTVNLQHEETMRNFFVISYAEGTVNSDPYYKENLVLGDLPAGWYSIFINYQDVGYKSRLKIEPGMVTYFTFGGKEGFDYSPPPTPEGGFVPPDATATVTP
jgi:murein DD-endopeptidase MepM/ murein hydrolase activator NlpD